MPRASLILITVLLCSVLALGSLSFPDIPKLQRGFVGFEPSETKYLFVGDIMLARYVETLIEQEGVDYPFKGLNTLTNRYEAVIGNFEAPISPEHTQTVVDSMSFSVATTSVTALNQYVDYVSLANNHTFDQEEVGLAFTRQVLASSSISTFGDPKNDLHKAVTYLHHEDEQIALIGLNATEHEISSSSLASLFNDLRQQSSMQIVYIHWGEEYESLHSQEQELLAYELIDYGADVIIGHHPHVIQDVALYKGVPIFYSLGNFIFDQYFSDDVQVGLGVELSFTDREITYRLIPFTTHEYESSPRLMTYDERQALLNDLAARSDSRIAAQLARTGEITISKSLASL